MTIFGLDELSLNEEAYICGYCDSCSIDLKRRFVELGFVPGTRVKCELLSPLGDPKAYGVKNTVIAVRREDSKKIKISKNYE